MTVGIPADARRLGRFLAAVGLAGFAGLSPVQAQEWQVPEAPLRARIECATNKPWPTEAGHFLLYPCGLSPTNLAVRVIAASGKTAASQVLWAEAGEPLKVMFDCSDRQTAYSVYFGGAGMAGASTPIAAGVVLETRQRGQGGVDSWKNVKTMWDAAGPPVGRSLVPAIYQGVHLHGPTANFLSFYRGYFDIRTGGDYAFATISDDASFLFIDGNLVAQWPGWHGPWEGVRGEHNGRVQLVPGRHKIEYWNAQDESGFTVAAAWRPPGQKNFQIMPATAFVPVTPFYVMAVESASGMAAAGFGWGTVGHCMLDTNAALVCLEFRVLKEQAGFTYRWLFDDGSEGSGPTVRHVFMRQGFRNIRLEALSGPKNVATLTQTVRIHPLWEQAQEWPDDLFEAQKAAIMARDFSSAPIADIVALLRLAGRIRDLPILARVGRTALERRAEFAPECADVFYVLGLSLQHPEIRQYGPAEMALRTVLSMGAADAVLKARTGIHLGGFLIHASENIPESISVLQGVDEQALSDQDRRLRKIYESDALLAGGDVEGARRGYLSVGTAADGTDRQYLASRRARLETARDFLRRGEFEDAERTAREIEWETPIERLNAETGLIMIGAQIGRKEYPFALTRCHLLLRAGLRDASRAEVLFDLVEVNAAMGRREEAGRALRMLLEEHRYSEPAARARERWGEAGFASPE